MPRPSPSAPRPHFAAPRRTRLEVPGFVKHDLGVLQPHGIGIHDDDLLVLAREDRKDFDRPAAALEAREVLVKVVEHVERLDVGRNRAEGRTTVRGEIVVARVDDLDGERRVVDWWIEVLMGRCEHRRDGGRADRA